MRKITKTHAPLQVKKSFTIVVDSIDDHPLNRAQRDTYRKWLRHDRAHGEGECTCARRQLAADFNMEETTLDKHNRALRRAGLLTVIHRRSKIGCRVSDTNIWRVKGGVSKKGDQVLKAIGLKTTTTREEKPRDVDNPAREARREQDRRDHQRMRERYEARGREMAEEFNARMKAREENRRWWREGHRSKWDRGRQHRLEQAMQRTAEALIGTYPVIPLPPMTEEDIEFRKRMDEREAERKAELARAEEERKQRELKIWEERQKAAPSHEELEARKELLERKFGLGKFLIGKQRRGFHHDRRRSE